MVLGVQSSMGCNTDGSSWMKCSYKCKHLLASRYKKSFLPSALVSSGKSPLRPGALLHNLAWKTLKTSKNKLRQSSPLSAGQVGLRDVVKLGDTGPDRTQVLAL